MAIKSHLELSNFYKEALRPILGSYDDIKILRIIKDAYLLPKGNVKENVDIIFEFNGAGECSSFPWYLPKVTSKTRVAGIKILYKPSTKNYLLTEEDKTYKLKILLNNVVSGLITHLQFEYYLINVSEHKNGFLYNELYYPMAFIPAKSVESLDIRIYLPDAGEPEFDSNFPYFISVVDNGKNILLTSQEKEILGDFVGYLKLKYKSIYYRPFWTFVIGASLSAAIRLAQILDRYIGNWWYAVIPIFLFASLYFAYYKLKD